MKHPFKVYKESYLVYYYVEDGLASVYSRDWRVPTEHEKNVIREKCIDTVPSPLRDVTHNWGVRFPDRIEMERIVPISKKDKIIRAF